MLQEQSCPPVARTLKLSMFGSDRRVLAERRRIDGKNVLSSKYSRARSIIAARRRATAGPDDGFQLLIAPALHRSTRPCAPWRRLQTRGSIAAFSGNKDDDRAAHIEPAQQVAFAESRWAVAQVDHLDDTVLARPNFTAPGRTDAADVERADEDQTAGPMRSRNAASAVHCGETALARSRGRRVYAEQVTGHVARCDNLAVYRRMDAMIVVRRQINRCKRAIDIVARFLQVGRQQVVERVVEALRLKNLLAADLAGALTVPSTGATMASDPFAIGRAPSSSSRMKKSLNVAKSAGTSSLTSSDIDIVQADEPRDQKVFYGCLPDSRDAINDAVSQKRGSTYCRMTNSGQTSRFSRSRGVDASEDAHRSA